MFYSEEFRGKGIIRNTLAKISTAISDSYINKVKCIQGWRAKWEVELAVVLSTSAASLNN